MPPLFHPNVYPSGEVCSSFLSSNWMPESSIADILKSLQALFSNPNPADPANTRAYALFVTDFAEYEVEIRRQVCQENTLAQRCDLEPLTAEDIKKRILSDVYVTSDYDDQNVVINLT
jgi:molybdopterin-biosynthesis enzyme MoeA-like protein